MSPMPILPRAETSNSPSEHHGLPLALIIGCAISGTLFVACGITIVAILRGKFDGVKRRSLAFVDRKAGAGHFSTKLPDTEKSLSDISSNSSHSPFYPSDFSSYRKGAYYGSSTPKFSNSPQNSGLPNEPDIPLPAYTAPSLDYKFPSSSHQNKSPVAPLFITPKPPSRFPVPLPIPDLPELPDRTSRRFTQFSTRMKSWAAPPKVPPKSPMTPKAPSSGKYPNREKELVTANEFLSETVVELPTPNDSIYLKKGRTTVFFDT